MESSNVVKGAAAEATAYNLLRVDVITAITAGSVTRGVIDAHIAEASIITLGAGTSWPTLDSGDIQAFYRSDAGMEYLLWRHETTYWALPASTWWLA